MNADWVALFVQNKYSQNLEFVQALTESINHMNNDELRNFCDHLQSYLPHLNNVILF